jgi:hypothetical protein
MAELVSFVTQPLHAIRRELRLLGDHEVRITSGGTDWNEIYDRLGSTFTAKEMGAMTGARAGLVASIVHRWRAQGRIIPVRRVRSERRPGATRPASIDRKEARVERFLHARPPLDPCG